MSDIADRPYCDPRSCSRRLMNMRLGCQGSTKLTVKLRAAELASCNLHIPASVWAISERNTDYARAAADRITCADRGIGDRGIGSGVGPGPVGLSISAVLARHETAAAIRQRSRTATLRCIRFLTVPPNLGALGALNTRGAWGAAEIAIVGLIVVSNYAIHHMTTANIHRKSDVGSSTNHATPF